MCTFSLYVCTMISRNSFSTISINLKFAIEMALQTFFRLLFLRETRSQVRPAKFCEEVCNVGITEIFI